MIYTAKDIDFKKISPTEFERLCFELLIKLGYRQLTWRKGGADSGRDIEGNYRFTTPLTEEYSRWFFECKNYEAGVPPEQLHTKLVWADAEQPQYLVLFISSYLTNNARKWLDVIRPQKHYQIKIIEGQELKQMLLQYPELVEQFFDVNSYVKLMADSKRHWLAFNVEPSYGLLWTLANHIELSRLTLNDLGFLFIALYHQYEYDYEKDNYYERGDPKVLAPLYPRLTELANEEAMSISEYYRDSWDWNTGCGFADALQSYIPGLEGEVDVTFQYNKIHLMPSEKNKTFAIGHYLFFKTAQAIAFEIFCIEDADFTTTVRMHKTVTPEIADQLLFEPAAEFSAVLQRYATVFKDLPAHRRAT